MQIRNYKSRSLIIKLLRIGVPETTIAQNVQECFGEGKDIPFASLVSKIKRQKYALKKMKTDPPLELSDNTLLMVQRMFDEQHRQIKGDVAIKFRHRRLFDTTNQKINVFTKLGHLVLQIKRQMGRLDKSWC